MAAAQQELIIEQGATFQTALTFNEPKLEDGSPGDPIDVSTWVFAGQIRSNYSSSIDIQDFTFSAGLTTNQVLMSLTSIETSDLPVKPTSNYQITGSFYSYDVFATLPDTTVLKILLGSVTVIPRVTQ